MELGWVILNSMKGAIRGVQQACCIADRNDRRRAANRRSVQRNKSRKDAPRHSERRWQWGLWEWVWRGNRNDLEMANEKTHRLSCRPARTVHQLLV